MDHDDEKPFPWSHGNSVVPTSERASVKSQGQAQGGVDLLHLVKAHVPDELPETLGRDGGGLLG